MLVPTFSLGPHRPVSEEIRYIPIEAEETNTPMSGRLFFLDLSDGRILSANPDGSDLKTIINEGRRLPMAWRSMLPLGTSTGAVWAIPRPMTARSCGPISGQEHGRHRSARRHINAEAAPDG